MSGSKKLNNKSNVISENFKQFRKECGYSQRGSMWKIRTNGIAII